MDREDIGIGVDLPIPPPPRGDFDLDDSDEFEDDQEDEEESYDDDDDDDDDDVEDEEEDDSSLDHHTDHRQYNQHRLQYDSSGSGFNSNNDNQFNFMDDKARSRSTPSPSLLNSISKINCGNNSNDNKKLIADDDENNNSMLFFGEDTMHVLMDAELRLKSVPPTTPSTSSSVSYTPRSNAGVAAARVTAAATMAGSSFGGGHETKGQQVSTVDGEINGDEEDGLSTGAASLLRGPIMAANSASQIMHSHDIGGKISDASAGIWTESGKRQMTIHTHQDAIGANLTPSMFRKHFLPDEAPTPSQVRRGFVDDVAATKKTPVSTSSRSSVHEFGSGGYQKRHAIHHRKQQPNNTPSLARSHFLPSPQDSVSTMGQLSPSEEYHAVANGPATGAVDNSMQQHQYQYASAGSNENKTTNTHPSIDGMIALGEKQMRLNTSFNISNIAETSTNPQVVPKKPFLLKGTRREPSALHTRINKSNPAGVGLTPSTARLQQQGISPHHSALPKSSDGPIHSNVSDTIESQSVRKERLARLEKMQEDLIHDLERRLARKEEARDDRRRTKMMAKKKVTSTPTFAIAKRAVVTSQQKQDDDDEDACVTPSQMRTPATQALRQVSSAKGGESVKISRAHSGRNSGTKPSVADNTKTGQHREDIITPSQARRSSSPSADSIVEKYVARRNGDITDEQNLAHQGCHGKIRDSKGLENGETIKSKTKQQAVRSMSKPRPQTTVRTGNLSRGAASIDVDEKKAFEEWKKKEEEQWALIKNMRKRQEAALREAEGERERAKAWAVAEKETVQKWAKEQRAAIEKYRHKAANAALIASKESNKGKLEGSNTEELKAMKAELEELRVAVKCQTDKEKAEIKKLREVIREQEKTIDAIKGRNEGGGANTATSSKSSGGLGPRPVLSDGSSKLNTKQQQLNSTSKTLRKAVGEQTSKTRKCGVLVDITEETRRDEDIETSCPTKDEPSGIWLQRHLSKLNDANNRLGERLADGQHHGSTNSGEMYQFTTEDNLHRKPYNAADYSGKTDDIPNQVTNISNPAVPSFVTAPSPSRHIKFADQSRSKSQIVNYKNGTQKEVLPDGTTTISFANGDRKRTYANEKEGIVVYYYASTKTTQVTHQDGMQTYHFPNGQIENHYTDGRKEITFPDNSTRIVHADGSSDTVFADGVRVMDYPDGRQVVVQPR